VPPANGAIMVNDDSKRITITPSDDGPYIVMGRFRVMRADGTIQAVERVALLCRCGNSKSKPFCDSSHVGRFQSVVRAPKSE
jgi:CDGSH iron-sulfur domain-containing protein 3